MRKKWLYGVIMAGVLTAVACSDDEVTAPEDPIAPAPPPASSLQFDLGFFDDPRLSGDTHVHWVSAALTVFALNTMVHAALTPPAVVLALALDTTPSYLGDNAWMWIYTWTDGADEVQIRLRGELMENEGVDEVGWQLFVTNTAEQMDNVLWFTGDASIDGRSGGWMFFDIDGGNFIDEFVSVDWTVNDELGVVDRDLIFAVHMGENDGDSLAYRVLGPDVTVTLHDDSESSDAVIAWDEATGEGYIEAPGYNGGDRGCWDDTQTDVTCPEEDPV